MHTICLPQIILSGKECKYVCVTMIESYSKIYFHFFHHYTQLKISFMEKVTVLTCDVCGAMWGIVDLNLSQEMGFLQQVVQNIFFSFMIIWFHYRRTLTSGKLS